MKLLFLHPNFPAQFKYLATAAAKYGNEVKFLCQTHFNRKIEGVQRLTLKGEFGHESLKKENLGLLGETKKMSEQYREGCLALKNSGWDPDVVISHSGWGCGLCIKEIWPRTHHIAYLEWWFNPESEFFTYNEKNKYVGISKNSIRKCWQRNVYVSHELACSDVIVAPTSWQKKQLPPLLRRNCHVIFDGVDTKKFQGEYQEFDNDRIQITYGTRGMDPFRGFPEFITAIPKIISSTVGEVTIDIAGFEGTFYGSKPKNHNTWKEWAEEYLNFKSVAHMVKWKGYMEEAQYINWLKSSDCHIYFTHPFVPSWSLVDALASGCPLLVSDIEALDEFVRECEGVTRVDHRSTEEIVTRVIDTVKLRRDNMKLRFKRNLGSFSLENSLSSWEAVSGVELTTQH
ncbi:hypothetical protein [Synechococcus sp. MU1617]|uniref:glycosyltransferase n=1 Tax=Synechococcus sp. MU1617 TaxID=2508346 RepID=UPI001CF86418|nr:hypothetical protein [Synechococcus sp. MU1617]MCB4389385.1 hypothetical protein [Synechococcus sp. MU1617]